MPKPKGVPPWGKEATGKSNSRGILARAIRANDNRARYARDAQERVHYLEANRVLERKRAQLTHKPPHQKGHSHPQSP